MLQGETCRWLVQTCIHTSCRNYSHCKRYLVMIMAACSSDCKQSSAAELTQVWIEENRLACSLQWVYYHPKQRLVSSQILHMSQRYSSWLGSELSPEFRRVEQAALTLLDRLLCPLQHLLVAAAPAMVQNDTIFAELNHYWPRGKSFSRPAHKNKSMISPLSSNIQNRSNRTSRPAGYPPSRPLQFLICFVEATWKLVGCLHCRYWLRRQHWQQWWQRRRWQPSNSTFFQ